MKNLLIIVVLGLLLSCNKESSKGFVLKGDLIGVPNGTKIALLPYAKYETKAEFETIVEHGEFILTGSVPEPRMYHLALGDEEAYYLLMIENSRIHFIANVTKIPVSNNAKARYNFENVEVIGSKSNDYFYSQYNVRNELDKLYESNQKRFKAIRDLTMQARKEKNTKKLDSITQLAAYKSYEQAEKDFFVTAEKKFESIIEQNKETYWGPLMMLTLYSYLIPEQRPVFDSMSQQAKQSYYGKMIEEDLYPANREGEKVPDFTTTGPDGKTYALYDLIKDKKVVLIDFWASWCAPCRKELPNVKDNYNKYAAKGFDVISISIDKNAKAWQKALKEEQMPWLNFNDNDVASLYKVKAVPTTYLIDNEGKLIADNIKGEDLGKKLVEIFVE